MYDLSPTVNGWVPRFDLDCSGIYWEHNEFGFTIVTQPFFEGGLDMNIYGVESIYDPQPRDLFMIDSEYLYDMYINEEIDINNIVTIFLNSLSEKTSVIEHEMSIFNYPNSDMYDEY